MARTYSDTRVGKLNFVPAMPLEQLYTYNFEIYRKIIEGKQNRLLMLDNLFLKAIDNPNVLQHEFWSEFYDGTPDFGYEYEYVALFDPDTCTMKYNSTRCPNYTYHHLGTHCPVCGSD